MPHLEVPPWKLCLGPVCMCPVVSSVLWRLRTRPRRWGRIAAARRGWRQNLPSGSEKRGSLLIQGTEVYRGPEAVARKCLASGISLPLPSKAVGRL